MRRGWQWPVLIVAILASGIGANLFLVLKAHGNLSFAVEPGYYEKALAWDAHQAQEERNRRLGWRLLVATAPSRSLPGTVELRASLLDRDGRPLDGAAVTLEAFHLARAGQVESARLAAAGDGAYTATIAMRREGIWEFRFEVERGGVRFTEVVQREVFL